MKYDVLYNFISPVTGRLPIEEGYILIGGGDGFSIKSPILIDMRLELINLRRDVNDIFDTSFIIGFPDIDFPQAQVLSELEDGFMYNTAGIVSTSSSIPIIGLPDLTHKNLWIGNSSNRPEETQRIQIDNLPNLSYKTIWRGNISGRPEPTEDLTQLESKVTNIEADIAALEADIAALEADIIALDAAVVALEAAVVALEAEIVALEAEIVALEAEIAALEAEIIALDAAVIIIEIQLALLGAADDAIQNRLTALENDVAVIQGQIGVILAQITILENQMIQVQQDIVDINFRIDNLEVTLEGDVTGIGNINSPIVTTLQLTLDEIKIAQDTVNLNDQKIINLKSDEVEQKDALNAKFLWDLMHDQVEVVWA